MPSDAAHRGTWVGRGAEAFSHSGPVEPERLKDFLDLYTWMTAIVGMAWLMNTTNLHLLWTMKSESDHARDASNRAKHGIGPEEAREIFSGRIFCPRTRLKHLNPAMSVSACWAVSLSLFAPTVTLRSSASENRIQVSPKKTAEVRQSDLLKNHRRRSRASRAARQGLGA